MSGIERKTAVISNAFPEYIESLKSIGFDTVAVRPYKNICYNPEAAHADMQVLRIGSDTIILLKNNSELNNLLIGKLIDKYTDIVYTDTEIGEFGYPDCVKLNVALVGKYAIGNFKYSDSNVLNALWRYKYTLINVKQGYAKCSTSIVSDNAIMTSDISIYNAVKDKIDCLKISEGHISLCEKYEGFIGGASFLADSSTLAFMGDVTAHPDYISMKSFCKNHGVELLSLGKSPLCDVGGVILL